LITDGIYGKQTSDALMDFKRKNGLKVNEEADPETFSKLKGR
jgi:peptidoglycan hydrolase-like protein with peptidoglycan-binding domain